ncbi:hypothetical protein Tco_1452505, partial [Tanacetum coccineum]
MNTHQQSLAYARLENRPPMLEKGSYVPWPSQFMRYIDGKKETRKLIKDSIVNGPCVIKEIHDSTSTLENPIKRLQIVDYLMGDEKKILRTTANSRNGLNVHFYNFNAKGHYARDYPKPKVRDSKYFQEQLLHAKKYEAVIILDDKQNDFLHANASDSEEFKDLNATVCMMAWIQQAENDSDNGLIYDYEFTSE